MRVYFKGNKLPETTVAIHTVEASDEYSYDTAIELVKSEVPNMGWKIKSAVLAVVK